MKKRILPILALLFSTMISMAQVNFNSTGLSGISINNPTSLDFGPDGRLYVSVQTGEIYAYTIQRNNANSYTVTATETILEVKNIQNHDDDGSLHATVKRQVTGILVLGTASNPIIYVSSSDYRIGGGGGGSDKGLDSNSGLISKLIWNGSSWEKIDLVRGLPRSEENHATNGLQYDAINNILYVAVGGNTNAGAPSNNFALITEYALSAAIVSIDLNDIEARPILTDAQGAKYIYDLPTLDDPTRPNVNGITDPNQTGYNGIDVNDPFGGNDGLNQAKWISNGPVQVYASGFRNAYDIVLTDDGRMYTWDNGANQGWGGHPDNEGVGTATNNWVQGEPGSTGPGPNDAMVNNKDGLHFINAAGYYGGHPNPIRANPSGAGLFTHDHANGSGGVNGVWRTAITNNINTTLPVDWPPVDLNLAQPVEGDFQNAGVDDLSLYTITASTNGMVEYKASNFNNAMQGNLLAASFNGNIYRVDLNAQGSINSASDVSVLATGFGAVPLDVTAQGDNDIFPGTIWAATYGSNAITIFEPQDFSNCLGNYDPTIDEDGDGYTNADEIDNQTNPCSGASFPQDNDQTLIGAFKLSDLNDPDDDDDGILDNQDPFAWDAQNGSSLQLTFDYPLLNGDPGFGLYGLGFTGFMTNLNDDYLDLFYNEDNSDVEIIAGGAVGLLSFNDVAAGKPFGSSNSLKNGFQFGMELNQQALAFEVEVALVGPLMQSNPQGDQFHAFYLGNGDQDNFVMFGASAQSGVLGLSIWIEEQGSFSRIDYNLPGLATASEISLFLEVNPLNQTIQAKADLGQGVQSVGNPISFPNFFSQILNSSTSLAIGVAAGKSIGDSSFNATYDYIRTGYVPNTSKGNWSYLHDGTNCSNGSCPQGRHETSFVEAGDHFVLIGGREHGSGVNFYDPINQVWTAGANPPLDLHHYQAVVVDGLIYAVGGMTGTFPNEVPVEHIYIYDPAANTWKQGAEIPVSRRRGSAGAVVRDGMIYLLGGIQNGHSSGWVPWFDAYNTQTNAWTILSDAPRSRDHFHAILEGDKLYAAGGRKSGFSGFFGGTVPEVDVYDFNSQTWSTLINNVPSPQAGASVAVLGDELLLIGGESSANLASNLTQALSLSTGTWRNLDTLNTGRHGSQAIVNNQTIYLATGSDVKGGGQLLSHEIFSFGNPQSPSLQSIVKGDLSIPAQVDFGTLAAGQISQTTVQIKNLGGNQALIVDSIIWQSGGVGMNLNIAESLPIHLAAGDSLALNFQFLANSSFSDSLIIFSSGTNAVQKMAVKAEVLSAAAVRINCGGPEFNSPDGRIFSADNFFLSGNTYSKVIGISNTNNDDLYHTERWAANLSYAIPVDANGNYRVRLHFAEIYSPNFVSGARVMEISLEGLVQNPSFDIFDTVGGYASIVLEYTTSITDRSLDLSIVGLIENAKLSAIEVLPQGSSLQFNPGTHHFQTTALGQTDSITIDLINTGSQLISLDSVKIVGSNPTDFSTDLVASTVIPAAYTQGLKIEFSPTSNQPVVRAAQLQVFYDGQSLPVILNLSGEAACAIAGQSCDDGDPNTINDTTDGNCGCQGLPQYPNAFSLYINAGGPSYQATNGDVYTADQYYLNGKVSTSNYSIANTQDSLLYNSERWAADLAYAIPLPEPAYYRVSLHFAEIWSGAFAENKRVFSMSLEDSVLISNLDIYAETGATSAYILNFDIYCDDTLNITSLATINNAKISAIGIRSIQAPTSLLGPSLSSSSLSFSAQNSGGLDSLAFFAINPDSISYDLDSIHISGSDASLFSISNLGTLAPNDSLGLWALVDLSAANPGSFNATANLYFSDGSQKNLSLSAVLNCPTAGSACDDGDSSTINDLEDGNCNCAGTTIVSGNFALNINCGGPSYISPITGMEYLADQYSIGGYTHTASQTISNVTDSTIYSTCRIGKNMSYAIPLDSAGVYQVTLHFAEVQKWLKHPGKRVFDISIEGQLMIDDLDLVSTTGGGDIGYSESFSVAVMDGILNINTAASKDNSILMAIEISTTAPQYEPLRLDTENFTLSATVGGLNQASFHLINADTISRSLDSVQITGTGANYVSSTIQAGAQILAGDSILGVINYNAPSSPGNSNAQILYFWGTDTLRQTIDMQALCASAGTLCDDGDSNTINDIEDGNCNCAGQTIVNPSPGFSLNINCGGGALTSPITGKVFIADQYNIGGYTHSYSDGVANTLDSALYSTARIGRNMSYHIPVPENGDYEVTLHFAETQKWLMGPQRRIFDISAEGSLILDDIDIYTLSGGGAVAYSRNFIVEVNDGELDLNTAASKDNSLLVAIEVQRIEPSQGDLYLSPSSLVITANAGQSNNGQFYIHNEDSISRTIDSLRIRGSGSSLVQSLVPLGASISAGDSLLSEVQFNAPMQGLSAKQAQVIYYSAGDSLSLDLSLNSLCPSLGSSCDDGDSTTINDQEDGNCNCIGTPINSGFSLNINCGGPAHISPISGKSYVADQYNIGGYTHTYNNTVGGTGDSVLYSTCRIGRNMGYFIPVPQAGFYRVSLHFAELQGWLMGPNRRVFDISAEGELILDDMDIFDRSGGGAEAHQETFIVEITDGELDLTTAASIDNTLIVAIEIREWSGSAKNAVPRNSPDLGNEMNVYPNPLRQGDFLTMDYPEIGNYQVRISNTAGQEVWFKDFNIDTPGEQLINANLNPGIYMIQVVSSRGRKVFRLLVQ